ncbi:MAG: hypothetical protein PHX14_10005, partial [Syntrophomonadaceae bacterium]|nr:hypothetical protein [Syntrophomonadaceae bacterium]
MADAEVATGNGSLIAIVKRIRTLLTAAATEAKQDTIIGHIDGLETLLTAIGVYVDGLEGKDYATQATLAAILTQLGTTGIKKIIDAIATNADATPGSAIPNKGLMMAGSDGTNARAIKTTEDGSQVVQLSGS